MNISIIYSEHKGLNFVIGSQHVGMVREVFPEAEICLVEDGSRLHKEQKKSEIIISWGNTNFLSEEYCLYTRDTLKWIHCLSAGVEGIMQSEIVKIPGIHITNSRGIHGIPISEHVIGFLLEHFRRLPLIRANQRERRWHRFMPDELSGKTVGILGVGAIGKEIAIKCKAFHTTVYGLKKHREEVVGVDKIFHMDELGELLEISDVIINVLPLTPETEGVINREAIDRMKDGAVFVNVGRGKTVDSGALLEALKTGKLSGALLDAMDPEPLPVEHGLWGMEQVLLSPHMSADSLYYMDRAFGIFQENARDYKLQREMGTEVSLKDSY